VRDISLPDISVPGIKNYPWATWMMWALEERIVSLGWAAQSFRDDQARQAVTADLSALAAWPEYRQYPSPDLSSAHAGRILWTAATRWPWLEESLLRSLREACRRHVQSVLSVSDKLYGSVRTKADILRHDAPVQLLQNIPVIGTIGAALAAAASGHASAAALNDRVQALFGATLDLRGQGLSEAVAYDGYVLDFIADWLGTLPEAQRAAILDHPHLDQYLDQSYMLSAPGAAVQVAELSDVEPREMPFHLSAQAKLLGLRANHAGRRGVAAWLMVRCAPEWLRSDALAALAETPHLPPEEKPQPGALDAHYAVVLRSGWEAEDLAVAISCTDSPAGHVQCDNGTLVIGTRGNWLIADPGYQQYAPGEEREFTIGPTAHNTPLINGYAQTQKRPRRLALEDLGPSSHRVAIDLTACYPPQALLQKLVRQVWLPGNNMVVVADQIEAPAHSRPTYHWHAHPACAWWIEANWAMITLDGTQLWFTCPQAALSAAQLQRLPGSRGQLSLMAAPDAAAPVVWWAFAVGGHRPTIDVGPDGRQIRILDHVFRVS
jgi:hypothetical protein